MSQRHQVQRDGGSFSFPPKGATVFVARHFVAGFSCLAGVQMKAGSTVEVPETSGVVRGVHGEYPRGTTREQAKSGEVRPDRLVFVLADGDGNEREVKVDVDCLGHVTYELPTVDA